MGVHTFTMADHASSIAPGRLFKALCLDNHNLLPKILPQYIKSIDLVEGDPTVVGCVKQFNFPEGSPFKYLKNKVDKLDVDNFYIKYTTFEGDVIGNKLECIVYEAKIEPSGAGSHYILTGHFHTKEDVVMTEDEVKAGQEGIKKIHEVVEEYLLANPEVYA